MGLIRRASATWMSLPKPPGMMRWTPLAGTASSAPNLMCKHSNANKRCPVMNVTLIGLDLAKKIIQVSGVNREGKALFNKPVKRDKLLEFLAQYAGVTVAMEACSSSHYWGRTLAALGYPVRLIPPQHVKPFVKGNKNDRNDAFAITEAARRPGMRYVQPAVWNRPT